jgi:hypothetical protein
MDSHHLYPFLITSTELSYHVQKSMCKGSSPRRVQIQLYHVTTALLRPFQLRQLRCSSSATPSWGPGHWILSLPRYPILRQTMTRLECSLMRFAFLSSVEYWGGRTSKRLSRLPAVDATGCCVPYRISATNTPDLFLPHVNRKVSVIAMLIPIGLCKLCNKGTCLSEPSPASVGNHRARSRVHFRISMSLRTNPYAFHPDRRARKWFPFTRSAYDELLYLFPRCAMFTCRRVVVIATDRHTPSRTTKVLSYLSQHVSDSIRSSLQFLQDVLHSYGSV